MGENGKEPEQSPILTQVLTPAEAAARDKEVPQVIKDRMALVESKFGTPESRALPLLQKLQVILNEDSSWDAVCACIAFLGTVAPLYGIDKEVEELGRAVYKVHYFQIEIPK